MAGPVAAVWLDRIHFNTFCLSLIRTKQQKDGAQMSKSYSKHNNVLKGSGAVAMDPTAHLGNAAIRLG